MAQGRILNLIQFPFLPDLVIKHEALNNLQKFNLFFARLVQLVYHSCLLLFQRAVRKAILTQRE